MLISVVIPALGRPELLDRAIGSVLSCKGSQHAEIIVVDDGSSPPLAPQRLRPHDSLIRLEKNSGAAVCRNVGIASSSAKVVSLLDSDDYYVCRDFEKDYDTVSNNRPALYYCAIKRPGFSAAYPATISEAEFFACIFCKYPHIAQTSSLVFHKDINIRFDESLPKHQDWDFVYSALKKNISCSRLDGSIYFSGSDRSSLSRKFAPEKSWPWYQKLRVDTSLDIEYIRFNILCLDRREYAWSLFIGRGLAYVVCRRLSLIKFMKFLVRRSLSY